MGLWPKWRSNEPIAARIWRSTDSSRESNGEVSVGGGAGGELEEPALLEAAKRREEIPADRGIVAFGLGDPIEPMARDARRRLIARALEALEILLELAAPRAKP